MAAYKILKDSPTRTPRSELEFPKYQNTFAPNPPDFDVNQKNAAQDGKYTRSFSLEFIQHIMNWECKHKDCGKSFEGSGLKNTPVIAGCGHFFHDPCFKFGCPDPSCAELPDEIRNLQPDPLKIFIDLREAILKQKGYKCLLCPNFQPKNNSVVWVGYSYRGSYHGSRPVYFCVECAAKTEDHESKTSVKEQLEFRLIEEDDVASEEKCVLSSVDRTKSFVGSVGIQCCHCLGILTKRDEGGNYRECSFLKCGHIYHKEHLNDEKVYCSFCPKVYDKAEAMKMKTVFHVKEYLGTLDEMRTIRTTCETCQEKHSDYHIFRNQCWWCIVENNEKERKEKEKKGGETPK